MEIRKCVELNSDEVKLIAGTELAAAMVQNKYTFDNPEVADIIRKIATYPFHIMRGNYPRKDYVVYFSNPTDLNQLLSTPLPKAESTIEHIVCATN